jgi:hypothetical protein
VKLFQCWHFCRNVNGAPGHDWCHEIKDAAIALDNFRLYCPDHSEAALQILEGMVNDKATSREPGRKIKLEEESKSESEGMPQRWPEDRYAFAVGAEDSIRSFRESYSLLCAAAEDRENEFSD